MATTGQVFAFPATGERIIVRAAGAESDGTMAAYEFVQPRRSHPSFAHFHLTREEDFEILAGSAQYRLNGVTHDVRAGDRFSVPLRASHVHPWNTGGDELRYLLILRAPRPDPRGMQVADAGFATLAHLAQAGKLKADGTPSSVLQLAITVHAAMPSVYLAGVPVAVQRLIFGALARVARLRGYRAFYESSAAA